MSRVRPRPVDVTKQLEIVRDESLLDIVEGTPGPEAGPLEVKTEGGKNGSQAPHAPAAKKKKEVKEIPVPPVREVPGYTREYLPRFVVPETYIRSRGGASWVKEGYVEYDLDNEDEDWWAAYNSNGNVKLSAEKFEKMLFRLEVACSEANMRPAAEPGYQTDYKVLPSIVSSTSNLLRSEAIGLLRRSVGGRDSILDAVYAYWLAKRQRWGKPILRRLQAPTNPQDGNPFNVFRPREKVNRPQTRRRRENTADCQEKLRLMRDHLIKAMEIVELLHYREAKKRDVHLVDVEMARYRVALVHGPPAQREALEASAAQRVQALTAKAAAGQERLRMFLDPAQQQTGASSASYDIALRRALRTKRKRAELEFTTNGDAIAKLPAPPQPPDDEVLFCFRPDLSRLPLAPEALSMLAAASASSVHGQDAAPGAAGGSSSGTRQTRGSSGAGPGPSSSSSSAAAANGASPMLPNGTGSDMRHAHARVGRCGRVYVVRCNPLSMEPLVGPETILPPQSIPAAVGAAAAHEGSQPHWATVLDPCIVPDCVERGTLKALRDKRLQGAHQAAHYQADMYRVHQRAQNVLLGIPLEGSRPSGGGRTGPGGGGGGHVHTGPGVTGALSAAPSVALFHTPGLGAPQGSQAPPGTLSHTVGTPAPMGGSSGAAAAAGAATAPAAMQRKAPRVGPSGGSASGGSGGGGGRLPSPSPAGGAPVGKQAGAPAPSSAAAGVANAAAAVSAVASALASAAGPSPGPIPTAGVVTGTAAGSSTPGPGSGSSTPAGAGAGGSGSSGKKLLPTSKATSGPSSAALKRGPGRPPKSNKGGDLPAPQPMDTL